ncbi:hypothetical protein [Dactylosporangium cerinum]
MNEGLEALVRSAQEERARQAPDPDRVLRALPALVARRRRRRRTGLVALAALAVLAVVVPAVLVERTTPTPPTTPPSVEVPAKPAVPTLTFRPTWLPPGFKETIRTGHITADEAHATQTWNAGGKLGGGGYMNSVPGMSLDIRRQDRQAAPTDGTPVAVDVNGTTGTYLESRVGSSIVWAVDATHLATLSARGYPRPTCCVSPPRCATTRWPSRRRSSSTGCPARRRRWTTHSRVKRPSTGPPNSSPMSRAWAPST